MSRQVRLLPEVLRQMPRPARSLAELVDRTARGEVAAFTELYEVTSRRVFGLAWKILEECFDEIFIRELMAWHTDESAWPQGRNFSTFKEWFEIEFNSMVEDLCGYDLTDDA